MEGFCNPDFNRNGIRRGRLASTLLLEGAAQISADIAALKRQPDDHQIEALLKQAVVVAVYLQEALPRHKKLLESFAEHRGERAKDLREFQWQNGMDRLPRRPNTLKTILIAQGFLLVETVFMAAMLIEGGHVTVAEGLGFGFVFSAVNSLLALWTGFTFVRMAAHKTQSPEPKRSDRFVRLAGASGICAFGGLLAVLIFAASRVRATGSHIPFDFSTVGLWEGLNNSVSLAILATALVASAANLWKGATGFSDFFVGASDALAAATDKITISARHATERLIDAIFQRTDHLASQVDELFADVEKSAVARAAEIHRINRNILAHNAAVSAAKEDHIAAFARELDHRAKVLNADVSEDQSCDLSAFDALIIPLLDNPDQDAATNAKSDELQAAISDIIANRDALIADIEAGLTEFEAACIGITPFPHGNTEGVTS